MQSCKIPHWEEHFVEMYVVAIYCMLLIRKPYVIIVVTFLVSHKDSLLGSVGKYASTTLLSYMDISQATKYVEVIIGVWSAVP